MSPTFKMYVNIMMESSLFMGINVCGFGWFPLPTNLRPYERLTKCDELSCIVFQQTSYPWNLFPTNQQNFDNLRSLAPTNKNDSTVYMYHCSFRKKNQCVKVVWPVLNLLTTSYFLKIGVIYFYIWMYVNSKTGYKSKIFIWRIM